jgi:hypothetical protein
VKIRADTEAWDVQVYEAGHVNSLVSRGGYAARILNYGPVGKAAVN